MQLYAADQKPKYIPNLIELGLALNCINYFLHVWICAFFSCMLSIILDCTHFNSQILADNQININGNSNLFPKWLGFFFKKKTIINFPFGLLSQHNLSQIHYIWSTIVITVILVSGIVDPWTVGLLKACDGPHKTWIRTWN